MVWCARECFMQPKKKSIYDNTHRYIRTQAVANKSWKVHAPNSLAAICRWFAPNQGKVSRASLAYRILFITCQWDIFGLPLTFGRIFLITNLVITLSLSLSLHFDTLWHALHCSCPSSSLYCSISFFFLLNFSLTLTYQNQNSCDKFFLRTYSIIQQKSAAKHEGIYEQ